MRPKSEKVWLIESVQPRGASQGHHGGMFSFTTEGSLGVFSSLQSGPSAELETQTSKLGQGGILLSSLTLGQEEQRSVALGEVRLSLGA